MINVQFTDSTQTTICSVYGCPQDPIAHPNQGTVDSSDARYQAFINPPAPPLTVTNYQLKQALNKSLWTDGVTSLRTVVNNAVTQASQQIQDAWQYQATFTETDPMVLQIATAINEVSDIHTVFLLASTQTP